MVGRFASVEQFWSYYCHLVRPCELSGHSDFHLFKDGIKPMWEVLCSTTLNYVMLDYKSISVLFFRMMQIAVEESGLCVFEKVWLLVVGKI